MTKSETLLRGQIRDMVGSEGLEIAIHGKSYKNAYNDLTSNILETLDTDSHIHRINTDFVAIGKPYGKVKTKCVDCKKNVSLIGYKKHGR